MIYQLPTKSSRVYRGKYPERVWSWSMSSSPSQKAVGNYLNISKPVHLELNDGRRYIADYFDLSGHNTRVGAEFSAIKINAAEIVPLEQPRYDEMLELVRKERGY